MSAGQGWFSARGAFAVRNPSAVRRTRRTRRANRTLAALALTAGLFVLAASRVHVNASWSDDAWGYLLLPMGEPGRGDAVIFEPPASLGAAAPYLKRVRGVPGDRVSVDGEGNVLVNGERAGRAKPFSLDGRALEPAAPATIPPGHFYLHAEHADSHDSRYAEIGLVPREKILGRAVALPDVPWLGLEGPLVEPPSCGQPNRGLHPCGGRNGGGRNGGGRNDARRGDGGAQASWGAPP